MHLFARFRGEVPSCDILRIHVKSPKYRYVDELQKYKTHRIMKMPMHFTQVEKYYMLGA